MNRIYIILAAIFSLSAASCLRTSVPADFVSTGCDAQIFPDYRNVTVPRNIAPLNFMIHDADRVVAVLSCKGESLVAGRRNKVIVPESEWHRMLELAAGDTVLVSVFSQTDGIWYKSNDFSINVAPEPIDRFLSYRLIEPSYVSYEELTLNQRDVTSFDESVFFSTSQGLKKGVDQCVNCHSYQNYSTDNMLFHIRGQQGGTVIVRNGTAEKKTNLKRDWMISNPVYPAWHPHDNVIAFSTNSTNQIFHTHDNDKVEVQDSESHLVLYDADDDRMIPVSADTSDMETFPTWSPDGSKLYYCSAKYIQRDMNVTYERDMMTNYRDVHYGIYVRDYDCRARTLGPRRTILELPHASASLPRVSPDGRWLLFACGGYGCFHIWHSDADINVLDLESGRVSGLDAANSPRADSYPVWSSNGRWIVMASRRDDGNYSRVYISYFDRDGVAHKAFELPQKDPAMYGRLLKSYNRPELTVNEIPEIKYK